MRIFILIAISLVSFNAMGQSSVYQDPRFRSLVTAWEHHEFNSAFELSSQILRANSTEDDGAPFVRYLYLISAAAKTSMGSMSKESLEKLTSSLVGENFSTFPRKVLEDCPFGAANIICRGSEPDTMFSSFTNSNETVIYLFENYTGVNDHNFSLVLDETIILDGTLESIEINPSDRGIWILRVTFKNIIAREP